MLEKLRKQVGNKALSKGLMPKHKAKILQFDGSSLAEINVDAVAKALPRTFPDIEALARKCDYRNCTHKLEPGCRVQSALQQVDLDERRLSNYKRIKIQLSSDSAHAPKQIEL